VVIDEPRLGLLYSSVHFGDEDPVRIESMLNRRTNSKVIGHVLAHGVLSWTRPGMISANDELGLHSRVCVPVRWQGELVALIMVMDSDGSLATAETRRVSDVADRVAPLLVTELKPADQLVQGLVSSDPNLLRAGWASMRPKRGAERDVRSQLGVLAKVQRGVEPSRRRLIRDEGIEEVARVVRHT
jgi:hypothetical protein